MTKLQCQAYATIAVHSLIEYGIIQGDEKQIYRNLNEELYLLFDEISEDEVELKADKIRGIR